MAYKLTQADVDKLASLKMFDALEGDIATREEMAALGVQPEEPPAIVTMGGAGEPMKVEIEPPASTGGLNEYSAFRSLGMEPDVAEAARAAISGAPLPAPDTSITQAPPASGAGASDMSGLLSVLATQPQAQQYSTDPFEGLSRNQKMMLAFSAIKDAGMALQGKEGGAFEKTLGRFNDLRDIERKREIQRAELQARQQLLGSLGAMPLGPNPTPEQIDAHIAKLTSIIAVNPSMAPYVTAELARLNPMRERAAGAQQEIATKSMMIDQIDALLFDPDLGAALGIEGFLRKKPAELGLDENAARVWGRINQIKGGAFLQAFESLKGGGQITEIEGQKAEQAQNRLNTAQNEADFREALKEYKFYIDQGIRRLKGEQIPADNLYGQGAKSDPLGIRNQ